MVDPERAGRESVYNNKSIVNLVCEVHQTASSNGRMTLVDGRPRPSPAELLLCLYIVCVELMFVCVEFM